MRSTAATRPRRDDGIAPAWPPARLRPVDREVAVNLRHVDLDRLDRSAGKLMIRTPGIDRPPGAFDTSCPPGQVRSRPPHRLPGPRKRGLEAICPGLALAAGIEESDPIDAGEARSSLGKVWRFTKAGDYADGSAQPQSARRENRHGGSSCPWLLSGMQEHPQRGSRWQALPDHGSSASLGRLQQ